MKYKRITFIIIILIIRISFENVFASDTLKIYRNNIFPDSYKLQFAGNMGLVSVGCGYNLYKEKIQSSVFYGFTPKCISGMNIYTLSLKNSLCIVDYKVNRFLKMSPYLGVCFAFSGFLPLQTLPHLGVRLLYPINKRINNLCNGPLINRT